VAKYSLSHMAANNGTVLTRRRQNLCALQLCTAACLPVVMWRFFCLFGKFLYIMVRTMVINNVRVSGRVGVTDRV